MSEHDHDHDNYSAVPGDRRLQSLVYELDKKVHALELQNKASELELAHVKGEIVGLRSSTASSTELAAGTMLITEQIKAVSTKVDANRDLAKIEIAALTKDIASIRAILIWSAITFVGVILAAFQFKIVVVP